MGNYTWGKEFRLMNNHFGQKMLIIMTLVQLFKKMFISFY